MSEEVGDWDEVRIHADRIAATSPEAFGTDIFRQLDDVVAFARNRRPPPCVRRGYWPTLILEWADLSLEIFEDRVEVYPASPPGSFLVWYEERKPEAAFSDRFADAIGSPS